MLAATILNASLAASLAATILNAAQDYDVVNGPSAAFSKASARERLSTEQ